MRPRVERFSSQIGLAISVAAVLTASELSVFDDATFADLDEPGDPQAGELRALDNGDLQVVKASGNPSAATSSPDEEPVKHAAENGEAKAGTIPSEAITSTTSAAALVENEDVDKAAESIVADVHKESAEAAKQGSLQSAEADDGAADKLAEDSPSHAAGSEEESSVVDDIPTVAESQELSSEVAEGHMAAAGGENDRIVNVYRPNGTAKPGDATGKEQALASDFSYNVVSVVTLGLGEEIGGNVQEELDRLEYPSVLEFASDVHLMIDNTVRYFSTSTEVTTLFKSNLFFGLATKGVTAPEKDSPVAAEAEAVPAFEDKASEVAPEAAEGASGVKETEGPSALGEEAVAFVDERDLPVAAGVEEAVVEPEASSVSGEKVRAAGEEEASDVIDEPSAVVNEKADALTEEKSAEVVLDGEESEAPDDLPAKAAPASLVEEATPTPVIEDEVAPVPPVEEDAAATPSVGDAENSDANSWRAFKIEIEKESAPSSQVDPIAEPQSPVEHEVATKDFPVEGM